MAPAPAVPHRAPLARRRPFAHVPRDARQYAVRMRDGVLLATDVYLPSTGRRWPTLLTRLPYDKAGDECFLPEIARWFTERGYAVVVQDVRGKVRSAGDTAPFRHEVSDGYDTLDWVVAQTWCDGAIGMIGDSYYGFTQWAAAASGHPALRAVAPRVTTPDFADVLDRQGVFPLEMAAYWALETWIDEALYDYEGQLDWSIRPMADIVPAAVGGRRPRCLDRWALGRLDSDARLRVDGRLPALHLGGFWDFIHRGQISAWQRAHTSARAPQYLLLDAVDHGWTALRPPGHAYDDPRHSATAMAHFLDRYLAPLAPFYDHFLRDRGSYNVAPVRWHQAHDGWREDTCWPPTESDSVTLWLLPTAGAATGALGMTTGRTATTRTWHQDPRHPVPSMIHPYYPLIELPDERSLQDRTDVLTFSTEALTEPLDLTGPLTLTAQLTSSAPSAHLMATLLDIYPDGTAQRIADGAAAAAGPWPAGVAVDLGHAGYRLMPGHRMALCLASSAFPRYALHPGTDANPWTATAAQSSEQAIVLGGPLGAHLTCHTLTHRRITP